MNVALTIVGHGGFLVHEILGIRAPARKEGRASVCQDPMDQSGIIKENREGKVKSVHVEMG